MPQGVESQSESGDDELEVLRERWDAIEAASSASTGGDLTVADFVDEEVVFVKEVKKVRKRQSSGDSMSKKRRALD